MKVSATTNLYNNKTLNMPSFNGQFIKAAIFSAKEEKIIDKFIACKFNGKTNYSFLKKKNYNVYFQKEKDNIVMKSFFSLPYVTSPEECYIETLKPLKFQEQSAHFRSSLEWFEDYKKSHNGFNGFFEKIKAYTLDFIYEIKREKY